MGQRKELQRLKPNWSSLCSQKPSSMKRKGGQVDLPDRNRRNKKARTGKLVFNPEERSEFVNGFRKRKQERKKKGHEIAKKRAAEARSEQRKERKKALEADMAELQIPEAFGLPAGASAGAAAAEPDEMMFENGEEVITGDCAERE